MKRYLLPTLILVLLGASVYMRVSDSIAESRRQTANDNEAARLAAIIADAAKTVHEIDTRTNGDRPSPAALKANRALIEADSELFKAKMDNLSNHGYCSFYSTRNSIERALKAVGRKWEFDDQDRKIKEVRYDDKDKSKVESTRNFNYASDGSLSSTVDKFADGQTYAEEFFKAGTLVATRHFTGGCGTCQRQWKPHSEGITVYRADGKTRAYEQDWALDANGKRTLLGHLTECDENGRNVREWDFGAFVHWEEDDPPANGIVPVKLTSWLKDPTRLVEESLRQDGSVRKRTTFTHSEDLNAKPKRETFTGSEGGVRKVDSSLLRYPQELFNY